MLLPRVSDGDNDLLYSLVSTCESLAVHSWPAPWISCYDREVSTHWRGLIWKTRSHGVRGPPSVPQIFWNRHETQMAKPNKWTPRPAGCMDYVYYSANERVKCGRKGDGAACARCAARPFRAHMIERTAPLLWTRTNESVPARRVPITGPVGLVAF